VQHSLTTTLSLLPSQTAGARKSSTGDDDAFQVAGKGGKGGKKKKRGQKLDPSLLTYGVASSGGANRGGGAESAWGQQ
jgi:hypothetical protein